MGLLQLKFFGPLMVGHEMRRGEEEAGRRFFPSTWLNQKNFATRSNS